MDDLTKEQAIEILKSKMDGSVDTSYKWVETVRMAIKALEQEPCEDAISRLEAIRVASGFCHFANVPKELEKLPSVNPKPCDDVISRQEAEALFRDARRRLKPSDYKSAIEFHTRDLMLLNAAQFIHLLPSVTPEQSTGSWITHCYQNCKCSKCGYTISEYDSDEFYYCPNCGCRMIEPQESEDKDEKDMSIFS